MNEGFYMDLKTAELFYKLCHRYKIDDIQGRKGLMGKLVKKKKARYLRDMGPLLAGKNIFRITKND